MLGRRSCKVLGAAPRAGVGWAGAPPAPARTLSGVPARGGPPAGSPAPAAPATTPVSTSKAQLRPEQVAERELEAAFEDRASASAVALGTGSSSGALARRTGGAGDVAIPGGDLLADLRPLDSDGSWRWNLVAAVVGAVAAGAWAFQMGYWSGQEDTKHALRAKIERYKTAVSPLCAEPRRAAAGRGLQVRSANAAGDTGAGAAAAHAPLRCRGPAGRLAASPPSLARPVCSPSLPPAAARRSRGAGSLPRTIGRQAPPRRTSSMTERRIGPQRAREARQLYVRHPACVCGGVWAASGRCVSGHVSSNLRFACNSAA